MARPLVLGRTDHPTIWTPVYADVTDPKMTDWWWEQRESEEQKQRFLTLHKRRKLFNSEERDRRFVKKQKKSHDQSSDLVEYRLMTSVSMPVFDRRENAVRFPFLRRYSVPGIMNSLETYFARNANVTLAFYVRFYRI